MPNKRHLIFDLDGTVTESRQGISDEMFDRLSALGLSYDIIVISGAEKERIDKQLKGLPVDYIMAQSGNHTKFWKNELNVDEKERIIAHILSYTTIKPDMLNDRGCQISLSFVGHHADIEEKKKFDPDGTKRLDILKEFPFENETLECRVAGTTCLDYTRKDGTKGKNIERLIEHLGWNKEDCVYFGDKLSKGGNDETVLGVIDTVEVANPQELLVKLKIYG